MGTNRPAPTDSRSGDVPLHGGRRGGTDVARYVRMSSGNPHCSALFSSLSSYHVRAISIMHKTGKHIVNLAKAAGQPDNRTGTRYFRRQACAVISEANVTLDGSSIKGRTHDPLEFQRGSDWKNSPRRQSVYSDLYAESL